MLVAPGETQLQNKQAALCPTDFRSPPRPHVEELHLGCQLDRRVSGRAGPGPWVTTDLPSGQVFLESLSQPTWEPALRLGLWGQDPHPHVLLAAAQPAGGRGQAAVVLRAAGASSVEWSGFCAREG